MTHKLIYVCACIHDSCVCVFVYDSLYLGKSALFTYFYNNCFSIKSDNECMSLRLLMWGK